jgi:hypothetical protein
MESLANAQLLRRRRWRTSWVSSDDYRQPPKILPAFAQDGF